MTQLLILALLILLGALLGGGIGLLGVTRWLRGPPRPRALQSGSTGLFPHPTPTRRSDLDRYPARLAELSSRLQGSLGGLEAQVEHLGHRRAEVELKEDRTELARHYREDEQLLERRARHMRRVLALVWRAEAILRLRALVAVAARARPDLSNLPSTDQPAEKLGGAALVYDEAAHAVRRFVVGLESRQAELDGSIPAQPDEAAIEPEDESAVAEERRRAEATLRHLQDRMDRLADTLGYLADRCRTRQVVADAPAKVGEDLGGEAVFSEVTEALAALGELAEMGDRQLADAAMDNLAEDITHLERAGLEAQAEAEANLEVARLLEQFPGSTGAS